MKTKLINITAIVAIAIVATLILTHSFSKARNIYEADYAIRTGITIAATYALAQGMVPQEFPKLSKFVADSPDIQEQRALSIESGQTTGLDIVVARAIADHFGLDTSAMVSVKLPTHISKTVSEAIALVGKSLFWVLIVVAALLIVRAVIINAVQTANAQKTE